MACKRGQEHITFQTKWMSERLLDRGKDGNNVYSGGLILDVTYRFFATGYLLTTSMYCDDIGRWIPVQLSWIRGLSETYCTVHFTILFRQFLIPSLLQHKRENMAWSVVDFSKAQQSGFVSAYMDVFGKSDPAEALRKLKGCREHFRQSVTRVKRNRAVIMADEQVSFLTFIYPDNIIVSVWLTKQHLFRPFLKPSAWLFFSHVRRMAPPTTRKSTRCGGNSPRSRCGLTGGQWLM